MRVNTLKRNLTKLMKQVVEEKKSLRDSPCTRICNLMMTLKSVSLNKLLKYKFLIINPFTWENHERELLYCMQTIAPWECWRRWVLTSHHHLSLCSSVVKASHHAIVSVWQSYRKGVLCILGLITDMLFTCVLASTWTGRIRRNNGGWTRQDWRWLLWRKQCIYSETPSWNKNEVYQGSSETFGAHVWWVSVEEI